MGNGNWSAFHNLFLKKRNNTSITAKYISETNCHKFCIIMSVICLNDHLTNTFWGSHNIGRIYCFIRGDHNKFLYAVLYCCLSCLPCSKYIILDCLIWAVFHKWHMLMRSCMIDNIRMILCHNAVHTVRISNRCNQYDKIKIWILMFQLLLNLICIIFIDIYNDQLLRLVPCNLPAKLTSNRAATTCYENYLIFYIIQNRIKINFNRISSQQILYIDITKFADIYFTIYQLIDSRKGS